MLIKQKENEEYIRIINNKEIFDNSYENVFPQTKVYEIVKNFLSQKSEKHKRVLIYGFDGARADSMSYIIPCCKEVSGYSLKARYSAITELKEEGGIYLSYAGGNKIFPDTLQETSTAQGWASILTGKWGTENGVKEHNTLNPKTPTILMESATKGLSSAFLAIWTDHFTITYKKEIEKASKELLPLKFKQVKDEEELQKNILYEIDKVTDIIFGINEFADANGHMHGFGSNNYRYVTGVLNADRFAYELLENIKCRKEYTQEEWLFIITSDHGGHDLTHGTQSLEDKMTFIAINKIL